MKIAVWSDLHSAGRKGDGDGHDCCLGKELLEMILTSVLVRPVMPTLRIQYGATARARL